MNESKLRPPERSPKRFQKKRVANNLRMRIALHGVAGCSRARCTYVITI